MKNKEGGFTGVDIVIAMGLVVIFIPIFTTMFVNIYTNWMNTKRNAMANVYATQIIERINALYYEQVTDENIDAIKNGLNIPSGYTVQTIKENISKH